VRPVAGVVAPQARFLWERLTPGRLGLELTTALAVGGVGLYVFVLYVVVLSGDLGPTPLDRELLDLSDQLRSSVATDVAKVVTDLGAFPTCAALVVATGAVLAVVKRPLEIAVLVLGFALIYLTVELAKAGIERPRPSAPLIETSGSSFPSAHAAYATVWIAAALLFTRRLGLVSGATLVVAALALVAAVGLSRIYLRAHYWSDVAAGWGIGFGIFGLLAAIAMVVEHMRHNGDRRAPRPVARAKR
jgi:membrane-associated phospholipid phosphatase